MNTPQRTGGVADAHERMVRSLRRIIERGDFDDLAALLDPGVVLLIDGGGQAAAALGPSRGVVDVSVRLLALLGPPAGTIVVEHSVNGRCGLLARRGQRVVAVLTVNIVGGLITDLWIVVNPDKLAGFNRG